MKGTTKDGLERRLIDVERRGEPVESSVERQRLWRVVSVDNGTLTAKQVYDASENMIDISSVAGVAYDADNAPVADDLGTLLRLGDGSLFFFSRPGLTATVYVPANVRIIQEVGASNDLVLEHTYNGSFSVTTETFYAWKFDNEIGLGGNDLVIWGFFGFAKGAYIGGGTIGNGGGHFKVYLISEDFTLGTLDKATLLTLDTILIEQFGVEVLLSGTDTGPSASWNPARYGIVASTAPYVTTGKSVFGLACLSNGLTIGGGAPQAGDVKWLKALQAQVVTPRCAVIANSETSR